MMQTIPSDDNAALIQSRPHCTAKLLSRLTDLNNDATPELCSHKVLTETNPTNPAILAYSRQHALDHISVDDLS